MVRYPRPGCASQHAHIMAWPAQQTALGASGRPNTPCFSTTSCQRDGLQSGILCTDRYTCQHCCEQQLIHLAWQQNKLQLHVSTNLLFQLECQGLHGQPTEVRLSSRDVAAVASLQALLQKSTLQVFASTTQCSLLVSALHNGCTSPVLPGRLTNLDGILGPTIVVLRRQACVTVPLSAQQYCPTGPY